MRGHELRVAVAAVAGLGDARGIDGRPDVLDGQDAVGAVAAGAGRDALVAAEQRLAVAARAVLGELVHALGGIEVLHGGGVGMARRAEGGNVLGRRLAAEPLLRIVGDVLVLRARVAAVAGGAGEARARVDVVGEELCGRAHAGVVEREVAVDAPDRRRRPSRAAWASAAARRHGERRRRRERRRRPAARHGLTCPGGGSSARTVSDERSGERDERQAVPPGRRAPARSPPVEHGDEDEDRGQGAEEEDAHQLAGDAGDLRREVLEELEHREEVPLGPDAGRRRRERLGFLAELPRQEGREPGEQSDGDQPAHHVAQEEVGNELHRPRLLPFERRAARSCPSAGRARGARRAAAS